MADTVNLFGSPVKKGYVLAGGAVVVLAVGYGWYRNRQANAAAATSAAGGSGTSGIDPATGVPYADESGAGIDPATGYPYGSAQDQEALAQLGGGSGFTGGGGGGPITTGTSGGYTTNGQWAQAAESYLVSTVGGDANTVAAALGKYITGQPVTSDQVDVIEQAIAFTGYPPVNGPNGDPPAYTLTQGGPPPVTHTYVVDSPSNADTLATIATRNHNELSSVVALNTALANKYGTTGKLPNGTKVTLPYAR
jgi:hypothetical protein